MIKEAANWLGLGRFSRYAAAESSTQRRDPGNSVKSADAILDESKRRKIISSSRDLQRNFAATAWAIRSHLDFVSSFTFQANTDSPRFNEDFEALVQFQSRRPQCDIAGRHGLARMLRIAESRRVTDGDIVLVKYNSGHLQPIEADRIRTPSDATTRYKDRRVVHGMVLDANGAIERMSVHSRSDQGTYAWERDVPARNALHLGYFEGYDQIRGVSPLASAIIPMQDADEVLQYARIKAKVTQLFALAITRQMSDADDEVAGGTGYEVDFGNGPVKLELDPGDEASFLESKHPSTEFQAFIVQCLQVALKALDIPWSFFDESFTNFFGSRAALIRYLQSCRAKRADLIEVLDDLTEWWLARWVARGEIKLPRGVRSINDIKWEWVPGGVPWWNPEQEINGDVMAIDAKLRTRSEIRRERYGDDWRDVVRKLAEEEQFMADNGLSVTPAMLPVDTIPDADDGENEPAIDEVPDENDATVSQ